MIQEVLASPNWSGRLTDEDFRALSPLPCEHVNPYGRFDPDMSKHLPLADIINTAQVWIAAGDTNRNSAPTKDRPTLPRMSAKLQQRCLHSLTSMLLWPVG
jgi:hypothetical protein